MKKYIYILILMIMVALISGCSSSDLEITDTSISDAMPVTGQRILLQVDCIGDRPPFQYDWSATGGELEDLEGIDNYYTYWIAPATAGDYTVRCTVTDDKDNQDTVSFAISVKDRAATEKYSGVLCMAKYRNAKLGGIRIALEEGIIKNLSADSESEIEWDDCSVFTAMAIQGSSSSILQTIWGAAYDMSIQNCYLYNYVSSDDTGSIELVDESDNPYDTGTVNDMEIDNDDILWIGAENGLYKYDTTSSDGCEKVQDTSSTDIPKTYDIYVGDNLTLAATTTGVYELDDTTWTKRTDLPEISTYAVTMDADGNIWSIVDKSGEREVAENGTVLGSQPDSVAESFDIDLLDRIWCGRYYWDGSSWQDPIGITDTITKSLVSPEGLLYLIAEDKALWSW